MNEDTFENLAVWQRAHALSIEVYRLLADCRDRGFKDQFTRAANSIADNIAEGAERPGRAEYRQFIGYAKGSAGESRSQALRARALGYIPDPTADALIAELKEISRMLHALYRSMA
jgi:four helix bundle protein